jgi:hypothetical protein
VPARLTAPLAQVLAPSRHTRRSRLLLRQEADARAAQARVLGKSIEDILVKEEPDEWRQWVALSPPPETAGLSQKGRFETLLGCRHGAHRYFANVPPADP